MFGANEITAKCYEVARQITTAKKCVHCGGQLQTGWPVGYKQASAHGIVAVQVESTCARCNEPDYVRVGVNALQYVFAQKMRRA